LLDTIRKFQNKFHLDSASEILGIDYRSLALLRVVLAIIVVIDLCMRATDLTAHYTDSGVLSRFDYVNAISNKFFISFHLANGTETFQIILFGMHFILGCLLFLGYRTRIVTILIFAFTVSLHARNPLILNGGDDLLRLLLFWSIFLPMSTVWSIDSAMNTLKPTKVKHHFSVASIGIILQVLIVYITTFLFKNHPFWFEEYSAVHYIVNADVFVSKLGLILKNVPEILPPLTFTSIWLELIGPILVFVPWFNRYFKLLVVTAFILLHLGFSIFLTIGLFPYISMTSWIVLVPPVFWDKLSMWANRFYRHKIIVYCGKNPSVTYKIALLCRSFLSFRKLQIKEVTSNKAAELGVKENRQIFVLEDEKKLYYGFDATKILVKKSPLVTILGFWLPKGIREALFSEIYEFIGYTKYLLVLLVSKLGFHEYKFSISKLGATLSGIAIIYIIFWNMGTLKVRYESMSLFATAPSVVYMPGYSLHLYQIWNLFAPYPIMDNGWYVIHGELMNGEKVDVYNESIGEVNWDKPGVVSSTYENSRWRKYLTSIRRKPNSSQMQNYAQYLCRNWNQSHSIDDRLNRFEIYFMLELSKPPGESVNEIIKTPIWNHWCYGMPNTGND